MHTPTRHSLSIRTAVWTAIAVCAALLLATMGSQPAEAAVYAGKPASSIWKPGTTWNAAVLQTDRVSPEPTGRTMKTVFRMTVKSAPSTPSGYWVVRANMDNAMGPFAQGFTLYYQQDAQGMSLKRVGYAGEFPVTMQYATLLLGENFPLQRRIKSAPRGYTLDLR